MVQPVRRVLAAVGAVALGSLVVPPASTAAAAPLCQGQPATIVGAPRTYDLVGTPGDDVIVSNGSGEVEAGGGDDVVCLTGQAPSSEGYQLISLDAGPGDDRVAAALGFQDSAFVSLGAGADSFAGGRQSDFVAGGELVFDGDEPVGPDSEADVVDTGARGFDQVFVGDGGPLVDRVTVRAASSYVVVRASGVAAGGAVSGGAGSHLTWVDESPAATGAWVLDLGERTAALDDEPRASWSGFGRLVWAVPGTIDVRGTDARDVVTGPLVSGDLGAGDDKAFVWSSRTGRGSVPTPLDGGAGRDEVRVLAGRVSEEPPGLGGGLVPYTPADVTIDVPRGRTTFGTGPSEGPTAGQSAGQSVGLAGFDWYGAQTDRVATLVGGPSDDVLYGAACDLRVRAGGGDDVVQEVPRRESGGLSSPSCRRRETVLLVGGTGDDRIAVASPRSTLRGGAGADKLVGYAGPNRLLGGPGPDRLLGEDGDDVLLGGDGADVVRGGRGEDTCRAEYGSECERPRAALELPAQPPGTRPRMTRLADPRGDVVHTEPRVAVPAPQTRVGDVVEVRSAYRRGRITFRVRMRSLVSSDLVQVSASLRYEGNRQFNYGSWWVVVPPRGRPTVRVFAPDPGCAPDVEVDRAAAAVTLALDASCLETPRWVRSAVQAVVTDDLEDPTYLDRDEAPRQRYEQSGYGPPVWAG